VTFHAKGDAGVARSAMPPALASFDPDFNDPCRGEDIRLLQTPGDFEVFKNSLS
jgi:hypothetical protein